MNKRKLLITIGIAVVVVAIVIVFDTVLGNHRPAITSLEAKPAQVLPGGTCQIVCNATDRDGDELIYGWSASGGTMSGQGNTITWTAPRSEGSYNITVIVTDGRGGVAMDYEIITVRRNQSPTISSLTADADWTLPFTSIQMTCTASDPNGDELSYEWSAIGGNISGTGSQVTWNAPDEVGVYYITVTVRDDYDGSVTRTTLLSVALEQPPTIQEIKITKDRHGHCYLKEVSKGYYYYVGKQQMYDIECILADTSTVVSYQWSCDGGEISGEGSMITWTAPNTSRDVTITVIVSDADGNMAGKNISLNVVPCSTCTFGSCAK